MVNFNVPPSMGDEIVYMEQAIQGQRTAGDGPFTNKCNKWFCDRLGTQAFYLTTSGTSALEMAAWLCDLNPGDEVILPSFTFSSTANAFLQRGARLVFVDVRPDTMNIDETKIEAAITDKTKVITVVHYGGVACEMDVIMDIARRHGLKVVEDAAQAVSAFYHGIPLGTIGDFGCFSFHETKNYSMGEGGGIAIRDAAYNEKAEILREKGTDRSRFFRGQVDKYTWQDYGSSLLPSDILAAYLWSQLQRSDQIDASRMTTWQAYHDAFEPLADRGLIDLQTIPNGCQHNAHLFYLKLKDVEERTSFIDYLRKQGVASVFHYVPLHSAPAGLKYGRFSGEDVYTTQESERLTRLPMYYGMTDEDRQTVINAVLTFFDGR